MNWTRGIALGLVSAVLSIIACVIYNQVYTTAFYVDYSQIIQLKGIVFTCTLACLLMAVGYVLFSKWKGGKLLGVANIIYSMLSFASIIGVLSYKLPLEMEAPEMFPGLAIPMHFFPVLSFLTIYPFFKSNK